MYIGRMMAARLALPFCLLLIPVFLLGETPSSDVLSILDATTGTPRPSELQPKATSQTTARSLITIVDENSVAVSSVRMKVLNAAGVVLVHGETDYAGRIMVVGLPPGLYTVRAEKPGFYRLVLTSLNLPQLKTLEIVLTHEHEVRETIDVVASQPAIDPTRTTALESITTSDILNVPYPTSREIRNALTLIPTVVRDPLGYIHPGGASTSETLNLLDGFNASLPTSTFPEMHVSTDAVRRIDVETSRYSAEYGKGTSVLGFETGIGDDKYRYAATNFIPSLQTRKGVNFNKWVPRATVSGPIRKGKAWFFDSPDAEYDLTIVPELPDNADRATSWRLSNLAKAQVNITPANILSTEFLVNTQHSENYGLSRFNPRETTQNLRVNSFLIGVRDQHFFPSGALLETGVAIDHFANASTPLGTTPYILTPGSVSGSFFETSHGDGRRIQFLLNSYLAPRHWHGRHDFKVGLHADDILYERSFARTPISILRADNTLARLSTFSKNPRLSARNFEATAYAQDRWAPTDRLLIESGLRFDWDQIIRDVLVAPRLASTYTLHKATETKLSAGLGLFYSATNLDLVGRPQAGSREDILFAPDGVTPVAPPIVTRFFVDRNSLRQPRWFLWSAGVEHRFPSSVYLRAEFVQKRQSDGYVFVNRLSQNPLGEFDLTNARTDRYTSLTISLRHSFRDKYPVLLSYTRSTSRTTDFYDYNQSSPVFGLRQPGPLPWDAPNRLIAWGWLPAPYFKETTIGYALDYHTGFPFYAVNALQQLSPSAGSFRFPAYFRPIVSVERKFHLAGYYLALRISAENLISRSNAETVDNNLDSRNFLTFTSTDHRTFSARIRFLSRSKPKKNSQTQQTPSNP